MPAELMRGAALEETKGPSGLSVDSLPRPIPGTGEVLVRVRVAALNHRDVFISEGKYPGIVLPAILGSDGAGEVEGRGEVVINPMLGWGDDPLVWAPGASILGMPRAGTFAQFVCVPDENVHPKPTALSMREAAAIPLAGLTAYRAAFTRGELRAGETVLITGIGGGVQTFALLFAKHAGARTIVTSGSDEKLARARELGADVIINYRTDEAWAKTARAAGPIDLVIDSAGGDTLAKAIGAVRPGGRVVIYGATLGNATIRPFSIFWNHVDIRGTSMGSPDDFRAMLTLFEGGNLRPAIDRTYALDDISAAMERMEVANQFGKIVIDID